MPSVKHDGNVSLDEIYKIARIMRPRSLAKTFDGTVKEILGECSATGERRRVVTVRFVQARRNRSAARWKARTRTMLSTRSTMVKWTSHASKGDPCDTNIEHTEEAETIIETLFKLCRLF